MAYTKYGEFMRIQRIKHHEVMSDTANLFGVTIPFVSAVENGKKNVPEDWFVIISNHYNLQEEEKDALRAAIDESRTQVKLNLSDASTAQRKVAFQFQRSFDTMDDNLATAIMKLLSKGKKKV